MTRRRSLGLGAVLALTLLATWYAAGIGEDGEVGEALLAQPRRTAPSNAPRPLPPMALDDGLPLASAANGAPRMTREGGDLFAPLSWKPPPPPPPAPQRAAVAAAPPPRAPALPFRYIGRMEEDGRVIAFLSEGDQPVPRVVRQGDLVSSYRIEEITSTGMRLTYLPLNETQRMLFGSPP